MARLESEPRASKFEDETTPWAQWVRKRLNKFLMDTGVAYKDTYDIPEEYPFIKPTNGALDASGVTRSWSDAEYTPEENELMKRGMSPKDILIMRGNRNILKMVGK